MPGDVVFEDYTLKIKKALEDRAIIALEEAAIEIKEQAQKNTRVDTGDLKGKWDHRVDPDNLEAVIGNPLENALWEEFGTGEHAAETGHTGRAGYWVYVKNTPQTDEKKSNKTYSLEEAKKVVAILRSKGLDAYYTKGKKPSRALHNAFEKKKNKAKTIIRKRLGGKLEDA